MGLLHRSRRKAGVGGARARDTGTTAMWLAGGLLLLASTVVLLLVAGSAAAQGFVAVGMAGSVATSDDGVTWDSTWVGSQDLWDITYNGDIYVAVGNGGTIITSEDGEDWDVTSVGGGQRFRGVGANRTHIVAVDINNKIFISDDGFQTWDERANPTPDPFLRSVAYGNGVWVAVADKGYRATSVDGQTWQSATNPDPTWVVDFAQGQFLALSNNGDIITSHDGSSWTTQTTPTSNRLRGFGHNGTHLVALGLDDELMTSVDGEAWTSQATPTTTHLRAGTYNGVRWAVAGEAGNIITSEDGESWTPRTSGTAQRLAGLATDFWPDAATSTVDADPSADVVADGDAGSEVTVRLAGANDKPYRSGGFVVCLETDLGSLGDGATDQDPCATGYAPLDHGNGTYTATLNSTDAGTATITATLEGNAVQDEGEVVFTHGPATQLVFTTHPVGGTADDLLSVQPVVEARDAHDNRVDTDSTSQVALTVTDATATLDGTTEVALQSGVATFDDLAVPVAGTHNLTASLGTATFTAQSEDFTITHGAAAKVAFATQPAGGTADDPLPTQPVLHLLDQHDNQVTDHEGLTAGVTLSEAGDATLSGTSSVAVDEGVATYSDLHVDRAGSYTLTGTVGSWSAQSTSFTVVNGDPTRLAFATQPGGGSADDPLPTQPAVHLLDQYDNVVTDHAPSQQVAVALTAAGGATLSGATTTGLDEGVATFSDLHVDKVGTYTLTAETDAFSQESASFSVSAGAASTSTSTVSTVPDSRIADGAETATITVHVKDQHGNDAQPGYLLCIETTVGVLGAGAADQSACDPAFAPLADGATHTATIHSVQAGTATITATLDDVPAGAAAVEFRPGPASADTSTITADPDTIVANGLHTTIITVRSKDAHQNDLDTGGDAVCLLLSGDASIADGASDQSACPDGFAPSDQGDGTYTAGLTSTQVGEVAVGATIGGAAVTTGDAIITVDEVPPPPQVHLVDPGIGALDGGDTVAITGQWFQAGAEVLFDGIPGTDVTVDSATQINATTPANGAGWVDVTVTNPDTQTVDAPDAFRYVALPTFPSIAATATGMHSAVVTWEVDTDDAALEKVEIFRDGTLVATLPPPAQEHPDTSLDPDTTYCYRLEATDEVGNVATSTVHCATTPPDTAPPSVGPVLATPTGSGISLWWPIATDNVGVASLEVYRHPAAGSTTGPALVATLDPDAQGHEDPDAEPDGLNCYVVLARDARGNTGVADEVCTTWRVQEPAAAPTAPAEQAAPPSPIPQARQIEASPGAHATVYVSLPPDAPSGARIVYEFVGTAAPADPEWMKEDGRLSFLVPVPDPGQTVVIPVMFSTQLDDERSAGVRVEVLVHRDDQRPVAVAVADPPEAAPGQEVTLDASTSLDPDGMPLSFHWVQVEGPTVALEGAGGQVARFTAPALTASQKLVFQAVVDDGSLEAVADVAVTIEISPAQDTRSTPPETSAGPSFRMLHRGSGAIMFRAEGNDTAEYVWDFGDGDTATGREVMHRFNESGTFLVELTVSDGVQEEHVGRQVDVPSAAAMEEAQEGEDRPVVLLALAAVAVLVLAGVTFATVHRMRRRR